MTELQVLVTVAVLAGLIVVLLFDWIDMTVAGLLTVSALTIFGILSQKDILNVVSSGGGVLALLFGGMVVARTLTPTGIFEHVGARFLLLTRGSGKRFLLGLVLLIAPVCAFLPNATVVILLAPVIIRVAVALEVDFVAPMILAAIISNSAGLLTLVGDPATFLVGSAMGMTFIQYLNRVALGGLLTLLALMPLLPVVLKQIWVVNRELPAEIAVPQLKEPLLGALGLLLLVVMILLFLFGELLPIQIVPPAVAIVVCSVALLLVYAAKVESVQKVLGDIDWKTLIFIACMFVLVEALVKAGFLQTLSDDLFKRFGTNRLAVALVLLIGIGLTSSLLANIPVVAASVLMVKGYFVISQIVPEEALGAAFTDWPLATLPVFVAMMFGGTLGGNATLIGASANIVSAGICAAHGKPVRFVTFLRYGVPVTLAQLCVAAAYVLALHYLF
ncbi:MAG TPA: SLC13 family permease [Terriglobales bacterium]|nr:SLC13 family permease [Terriglobales bacterium]